MSDSIADLSNAPVQALTRLDIGDTAGLFGVAMCNLPSAIALWGSPRDARKPLTAVIRSILETLPHHGVSIRAGERVVGAMYMIEPGKCVASKKELLRVLPRLFVATGTNLPRVLAWLSLFGEHNLQERHWHLSWFAVHPEFQGKGIGSRLLRHFCDHVDSAGEPSYVATSSARNVRLYERNGFTIAREVSLFNVTNWLMKRSQRHKIHMSLDPTHTRFQSRHVHPRMY